MNKLGLTLIIGFMSIGFLNIYAEINPTPEDKTLVQQASNNEYLLATIVKWCGFNLSDSYDECMNWIESYVQATNGLIDDAIETLPVGK